jgi:hypothetical protein
MKSYFGQGCLTHFLFDPDVLHTALVASPATGDTGYTGDTAPCMAAGPATTLHSTSASAESAPGPVEMAEVTFCFRLGYFYFYLLCFIFVFMLLV